LRGVETQSEMGRLTSELAALREAVSINSQAVTDFQSALSITALLENLASLAAFDGVTIEEAAAAFGLNIEDLKTSLDDLGIEGFDADNVLAQIAAGNTLQAQSDTDIHSMSVDMSTLSDEAVTLREDGADSKQSLSELVIEQKETNRLLQLAIDGDLIRTAA
jgi:hypothetical protein